jgi:cytochrome oxidase Cu insertion factor (SCO1/SenC/PrrC family)/thiol-disulfide isomerase/thioredoxin
MELRTVRRISIAVGVGCLCLISIVSVSAALRHADPAPRAAAGSQLPDGTGLARPRRLPAMRLITARGRIISTRSWRGKWVVLAPSMTLCHEVCPMTTGALIQLRNQLDRAGLGQRVEVLEVSVDPWRDTPARLRAYRRLTGLDFSLLTGTRRELRRFWRWLGVFFARVPQGHPPDVDWLTHRPERFDVQHTDGLFIFDAAGRERMASAGMPDVGGHLSRALRGLLNDQGRGNLRHPQTPWTPATALTDIEYLMGGGGGTAAGAGAGQTSPGSPAAPSPPAIRRELAGSPPPLAGLHAQAGRLLGPETALARRLVALRGYPVVLNAWASWCGACRAEFSLLAAVSARFGRRVAFLGVNTNDEPTPARAFLASHRLSYPSYRSSSAGLAPIASIEGLPMTIFIGPSGRVRDVHAGQYVSSASLAADVRRYALGRRGR